MKLRILAFGLMTAFLLLSSQVKALDNVFSKATVYYQNNEYSAALNLYDSIYQEGYISFELLYNLGNCYFKKEDYAHAILYWERAKLMSPNNADVQHNLAIAQTHISDQIEPLPAFFLSGFWRNTVNLFSEKSWTVINISFWFIFGVTLFFFFTSRNPLRKKITFYLGILALIISLLTGFAGYSQYRKSVAQKTGIVITPTINIKSSPDESSSTVFVLHSGTKVKLLEQVGNWHQISIANGNQGWISAKDFEKI